MEPTDDILLNTEERMQKSVDSLKKELQSVRTGRASSGLIENLQVDYYGSPTPLNQLSSISIPEARTIIVQPWDKDSLSEIEKSILKSDLGLTPNNDGNIIRINIPELTEERRKEMVKIVGGIVEQSNVSVRNIRRDSLEQFRSLEKNKEISQDESRKAQQELQKITDSKVPCVRQPKMRRSRRRAKSTSPIISLQISLNTFFLKKFKK